MKRILILCTGNSCRSQMAEGYLRQFVGNLADVYSAGIEAHGVNPFAIRSMREDGIDISHQTSNNVEEYAQLAFDFVITVCDNAKERCPIFPATVKQFHKNFSDPAKVSGTEGEVMYEFDKVRDEIKKFCREFVSQHLNSIKIVH